MSLPKAIIRERIKELELIKAYAEFKIRAGDMGPEYDNWIANIEKSIKALKSEK